jgi:hypothetical protein
MKNNLTIDINDIFQDAKKEFQETQLCERLKEKYRLKPYHEKNAALYNSCKVGAYVFSSLSILTGCGFSIFLAAGVFPIWIAVIVGLIPLVIIYYHNLYQHDRNNWYMLLISIGLFAGSVFLSFKGTETAIKHFNAGPVLVSVDSVKQMFQVEIEKLDTLKATGQNTKWRNTVTRDATKLLNKVADQSGSFTTAMFQAVDNTDQANQTTINEHNKQTASKAYIGAYMQIFFAVMLFVMLWYQEYYDWQTAAQMGSTRTARFVPVKLEPPLTIPKPLKNVVKVSATDTRFRNIPETVLNTETPAKHSVSPVSETKRVIVSGYNKGEPMTLGMIRSKIKQCEWNIRNKKGKTETNLNNIKKLKNALT